MITVSINGVTQTFDTAPSLAELIQQMQLGGKRIAIERNGDIVPRSQFAEHRLADGDTLEIVVAVGGG